MMRMGARLAFAGAVALVLLAVVVSVALADPRWVTRAVEDEDVVGVLDASASMQTRDGLGSRFDRARDAALELVTRLPSAARVLVMTSAREPRLRSGFLSCLLALRLRGQMLAFALKHPAVIAG